jgi:hypothetical protein
MLTPRILTEDKESLAKLENIPEVGEIEETLVASFGRPEGKLFRRDLPDLQN